VQEGKTTKVQEVSIPELKPNEILLKTRAVGLNPTDWKHLQGLSKPGAILGCDFVGEVVKIGDAVPPGEVNEGEVRWGFMRGGWSNEKGAFAEYVPVEWDLSSVVPENVTPEEAASLPIPFLTAVQALYFRLRIPEPPQKLNGEWILIWSGNTSVGRFAIQLAKLSGLKVATTASPKNWDRLKTLGADLVVDYKDPDVVKKLQEGTDDSIVYGLDCISEKGSIQLSQLAFSPKGGHLICILFDLGQPARSDVKTEATIAYTLLGADAPWGKHLMKTSPEDRALYARWAKLATGLLEGGLIKPLVVVNIGGLEDIQAALDRLKKGQNAEKQVATIA